MNIYIDGGIYNGESVRSFLKLKENYFSTIFRQRDNEKDFKVYGFDPQPDIAKLIADLVELPNFTFIPAGIGIKDETVPFYKNEKTKDQGASIFKGRRQKIQTVEVQLINFIDWLRVMFTDNDYIVLKLDIEGSEFPLLEKLMETGMIEWIDELYVEFHPKAIKRYGFKPISYYKEKLNEYKHFKTLRFDWP